MLLRAERLTSSGLRPSRLAHSFTPHALRRASTTTASPPREGSIADAFASLSGQVFAPLEPRFAKIKADLIRGHEDALQASWHRLLTKLETETRLIAKNGSSIIPHIDFADIDKPNKHFDEEYYKRGVAVIRNVIPAEEVLKLKDDLKSYIEANPHTKAFPSDNPQVYEIYWSASQIRARSHPRVLSVQQFLLCKWHSSSPTALVHLSPISYADRLRMRLPGDNTFALGPHIDGGGPERWEPAGYGLGKVYDAVFRGDFESCDQWESSCRLPVQSSLYNGGGACSVFRMNQGWLSMSSTGPGEGTLLVNPLLGLATAYLLLRPFFTPLHAPKGMLEGRATLDELNDPQFLASSNWTLETPTSSWLHGATPGRGQELSPVLHPHLRLDQTMVHVPRVEPGDYVAWHCDTIHAVDKMHAGGTDSSVLYIPAAPLTAGNAAYLRRQREAFVEGVPGPDFAGEGEKWHAGRPGVADVARIGGDDGMRAFGLKEWDADRPDLAGGERTIMLEANKLLGFGNDI